MIGLSIVKRFDSVTPAIGNIARAIGVQGRRRMLTSVAKKFIEMTHSNFGQSSGKYKEKTGPPLSPAYAKRIGSKQATLHRTGELYNSIKAGSPRNDYIEVYTKNKYAAVHTLGSRAQHIPRRNFWPMQIVTPSYTRMLFSAEKELVHEIGKTLTLLSNGALPRLSTNITRSYPKAGSIFTKPQST